MPAVAELTGGRLTAIIVIARITQEAVWHKSLFESWMKRLSSV